MDVRLLLSGVVGLLAAAVHGIAGQTLVVRKLSPEALPPTRFGGPRMTQAMIQVTWHLTTFAFFAVGVALLLAGGVLHGDAARALGLAGAAASTGFTVLVVALGGAAAGSARSLWRHPAPLVLITAAALAWWGSL